MKRLWGHVAFRVRWAPFDVRTWLWRHCYTIRHVLPVARLVATHHEHGRVVREPDYVPAALDTRRDVVAYLARLQAAYRRLHALSKLPADA